MVNFEEELENYRKKLIELENKSKKDEMRCLMLETEVENLTKKYQELEKNQGDKYDDLLIENKVLECEKQKAESEICSLKEKVKELVSRVCELESNVKGKNEVGKQEFSTPVRKELGFEENEVPIKKMSPCTPGVARSLFSKVIDISDEEDMNEFKVHSSDTKSAKRKRNAKIVPSDDDDDVISSDDDAPICTLKRRHSSRNKTESEDDIEEDASKPKTDSEDEIEDDTIKPRLTRLRKLESENKQDKSNIELNKAVSSSEGSESEGESLGGFIVESSESVSVCDSISGDSCDDSEDVLNDFKVTLEKIGRKKVSNLKWDLEGVMLADFGKDPELCMRAVCALYRQQTADEKASKGTIHHNERGFSYSDAFKASKLAEFLTDGDSEGDLNKTVDELKRYDSKGIKLCTTLATKYSKQLFKIYQNKEDPYFRPQ